jgi:chemotaxis protein methyltransferase CheR
MPLSDSTLQTAEFDYVRNLARENAAIVLGEDKRYLVESRLSPLAERNGFQSLGALVLALQRSECFGSLHLQAIEALTTNETLFFRDRHPFDALASDVLPYLIRARRDVRRISIWSAAASSGQEAYSVAMLIRDKFPELCSWDISILGTDLSETVLAQARSGAYSQIEVNRGLPALYLVKYFSQGKDDRWMLRPEVRSMVHFRTLNLVRPWIDVPIFDVVLARNVLIYFGEDKKREVLNRIASRLAPDGFMTLGSAETPMLLSNKFEPRSIGRAQFYQLASQKAR